MSEVVPAADAPMTATARGIATQVLEDLVASLRAQGEEVGEELLQRARQLSVDTVEVALLKAAGVNVEVEEAALEARALSLSAAGAVNLARMVRESIRRVVLGTFDVLLELL